ncbi:MAG TPA: SRPBCC family protein [Thermoplasmata archaeon]|nr:SRPBCC family protein [Thermoplasmata archaeon]
MSQFDKLAKLVGEVGARGEPNHPVTLTLPSEQEILISRVFDAPPERVFRAHVDPKALADWWGPREYVNTVDRWEPRKGGAWRIVQRAPDSTEHPFRGVFQEVVPSKRLTWTFEYERLPGHVLTETMTFEPEPGGRTKLTVHAVFPSQEDRNGMLASGMEWGMREGYERLDDLLDRGA